MIVVDSLLPACCNVIGTVQVSLWPGIAKSNHQGRLTALIILVAGMIGRVTGSWEGRNHWKRGLNPRHQSTILDSPRRRVAGREGDGWRIYLLEYGTCFLFSEFAWDANKYPDETSQDQALILQNNGKFSRVFGESIEARLYESLLRLILLRSYSYAYHTALIHFS
ncbi:hypothetical protein B9Z19DRAFT_119997 [Tuber borchii]|uniref:Uncharacterized protein n=1 Tax=Tuber borchii TaxID=42251 RepID=A0A2T6ZRA8_TUBBO|nr:hypothetical protein B9Z19DRAFT_119997 [Tuber borchii]